MLLDRGFHGYSYLDLQYIFINFLRLNWIFIPYDIGNHENKILHQTTVHIYSLFCIL